MIAEAAYYLAQKRGFLGGHALDDWLAAEQQIRLAISPHLKSEASMSPKMGRNLGAEDQKPLESGEKSGAARPVANSEPTQQRNASQRQRVSRFEKFASTQAAGDGIEGEALKPGKTIDEKLGANMADRK